MAPAEFLLNGIAGVVSLVTIWLDDSLCDWNSIYKKKLLSILNNKTGKTVDGRIQFTNESYLRYNDYPRRIDVSTKGYELIMEIKHNDIITGDFKKYPDYEVYNIDSPFVGVCISYLDLVSLKTNVLILKDGYK